jgi:uncharacterized protein YggU (UPF0235/DUF167 family)
MDFLKVSDTHIGLWVWLKPDAKQDAVLGFGSRGFEMAVKARAIEGEANLAMIALLAKYLGIPKTSIRLIKGQQARLKYLELPKQQKVLDMLKAD